MPRYAELLNSAKCLPDRLVKMHQKDYSYGSFFCLCSPPILVSDAFNHSVLIQSTAACLEFYDHSDEAKCLVLWGIYIFVCKLYDDQWDWLFNAPPLLTLLKTDLKLIKLAELDKEMIEACYQELNTFCVWVYRYHEQYAALNALYQAFPSDMQATIEAELDSEKEAASFLSGLISQLRL